MTIIPTPFSNEEAKNAWHEWLIHELAKKLKKIEETRKGDTVIIERINNEEGVLKEIEISSYKPTDQIPPKIIGRIDLDDQANLYLKGWHACYDKFREKIEKEASSDGV